MTESKPSRRSLLKGGGVLAAGLAGGVGAALGVNELLRESDAGQPYMPEEYQIPKPRKTPGFDHLVVLMGENRSFDNLLGYLYTPDDPPPGGEFEGLAFGHYSNFSSDGTEIPAHIYSGPTDRIMRQPDPDPGEEYPHVNTQLFGQEEAPFAGTEPHMGGFVRDYEADFVARTGHAPTSEQRDQIMGSFEPGMLPVVSTLAREFGVFDHWFCAVPSQTFCNRSFFHASTSHGFVTNEQNGGHQKWLNAAATPTVFNRLEESGHSWKIYFDELQMVSFTGVIHAPVLEKYWRTEHFATMQQFEQDARDGALPDYAFIEPRMIFNHNDFHPPVGELRESRVAGEEIYNSALSDVRAGDALVHRVYTAIRTSMSETGSNYLNTALLLTFDEHGGTYDHVAPPAAVPPVMGAGEMGFTFDRLGCRVPAVLVSAHVERGSVFSNIMHHGSLAATLSERFQFEPLTPRDLHAPSLGEAFNRKVPRHVADWPQPSPAYVPPNPEGVHPAEADPERPLSPPAKGLMGLLLAKYGTPEERSDPPTTFASAYRTLHKYGSELFGVKA